MPGAGITATGLHSLTFKASNVGFLRMGGVFDLEVTLPGNWSTFGSSTGDVRVGAISSEFSIVQDFVYDASSNQTTFEALDSSYSGATADVQFTLHGAPIPEPQENALLLGLLPVLVMARRRIGR